MSKKWVIKIEIEQRGDSFSAGAVGHPDGRNPLPLATSGLRKLAQWCEAMEIPSQEEDDGNNVDFFALAREEVRRLYEAGRLTTAENYETAFRSFRRFAGRGSLPIGKMDATLLSAYQQWLTSHSVCLNSVSNYMRVLRAIYNRAVKSGLTGQRFPFSAVYTGIGTTSKRSITMPELRRLSVLKLPPGSQLELARDVFLFSFYTRGMPFVDIAFLTPAQIEGNVLTYVRRKTGRTFKVRLERCSLDLLRYYERPGAPYVFPILSTVSHKEAVREYRERSCYHNRLLKRVAAMAGLDVRLSFYVARHTWASTAFRSGVNIETIARALGHSSTKVTQVYIRNLEDDLNVNRANALVLRRMKK